jgi:large subunit ribosomal protein L33
LAVGGCHSVTVNWRIANFKDLFMRDIIQLACGECKRRNYSTTKNKKKTTERLEMKKYCPFCRKHQPHKEQK